eukprot:1369745-Prymnesium_polylepis.1
MKRGAGSCARFRPVMHSKGWGDALSISAAPRRRQTRRRGHGGRRAARTPRPVPRVSKGEGEEG